jgi:hypothetical protein
VQCALGWISALLLIIGAGAMVPFGDFAFAHNVPRFLMGAAVMAAGYAVSWMLRRPAVGLLWSVAVGTRFLLLFVHPANDIWRYVWEGRVVLAGFNPYQLAPNAAAPKHLRDAIVWPQVDQPASTAVYPPLAQLLFALMASLGLGVLGFKLLFAAADLGVIALLLRRFGPVVALTYAWNPLVIYSFAGGGHYDSLFILPILGALLLVSSEFRASKFYLSASLLGASIAIKWASGPLAFWWLWRELGVRRALSTGILIAAPMIALLWALFPGTSWQQLGSQDWITNSWSAPLLPGVVSWLLGFRFYTHFYLLPVLLVAAVIALRISNPWSAAAVFFFSALALSPAIHVWYFTWFVVVAASVPYFRRSARLVGISGFVYFWISYGNATQGVWKLSPQLTTLLWLPFVVPVLLPVIRMISTLRREY